MFDMCVGKNKVSMCVGKNKVSMNDLCIFLLDSAPSQADCMPSCLVNAVSMLIGLAASLWH
jgi:hypothetical protein